MIKKYIKIIIILFLIEHFIIIFFFINFHLTNQINLERNTSNFTISINSEKELINIQKYIDIVFNATLLDKGRIYYPNNNPKISIVISVFNGEAYLKTAVLSIQNQDFKDIEIVIIDDNSLDNSVSLIKEMMVKDPRIVLYQNKENRGIFYSKSKGILLSKGKYVMILDEDDMYVQRDAFSTLYNIAERNNLDLLNFGMIVSKPKLENIKLKPTLTEYPVIFQPEISEKMFKHNSSGEIILSGGILHNYFIKKSK